MAIPDAWGLRYMEVVSLTWLAYKGQGSIGRYNFPTTGTNWEVTNVFEHGVFRAVLVRGRKTVLSFSGTDEGGDWLDNAAQGLTGISPQYVRALRTASANASDVVVGHSLGGGLASYVAIYGGRLAATVNPAPLNINLASGIGMLVNNNKVVNYVAPGEALDLLDHAARSMRRVGQIIPVASTGGINPVNRHLLSFLAGFVPPVRI